MSQRIKQGCCAIDLADDSLNPESVVIEVNEQVLLTPNPISAQVLVMTLKRLLELDEKEPDKQIAGDPLTNQFIQRGKEYESEWGRVDKFVINGKPCIWISCQAISIYLSIEEAKQIVSDFEKIVAQVQVKPPLGRVG